MLVVLTHPQAELYRLLLRLTRGGTAAYRGCLGQERGMRTAVSGTVKALRRRACWRSPATGEGTAGSSGWMQQ